MEKKYISGWNKFIELCLDTKEAKTLSLVFDLLLTAEERESLAMRCLIVRDLLAQKKTQRKIAADLNVSIAKITRGSNELKRVPPQLLKYLKIKLEK